ncbi:hypothetical protein [Nocardiopsis kunsanensis]|uniref:hypothetical protein n=1 Tax=Nocardiopsis kunsanensis TaxID=141693 RepID=UPI00034DB473|nr:hypothetical protein [Nocardiopsis kunsanensis]
MPTASTTPPPLVVRRRPNRLHAFGAAFVGSTLIAVMAAPGAYATSVTVVTLGTQTSVIEPGENAGPNPVTVANRSGDTLCLFGLSASSDAFAVEDHGQRQVEPGETVEAGSLSGAPGESTSVTATLAHALADEEGNCPDGASRSTDVTWSVQVLEPTDEPDPTEDPTDEPDPTEDPTDEPTEDPEPTDEPTGTPSETERPTTGPTATDGPSGTPTDDDGGDPPPETTDPGPGDGSRTDGPAPAPPRNGGVGDPPTSDEDVPTLPRDDADLPDVPPDGEDLAELPMVSPGQGEKDDDLDGTEIASDQEQMSAGVAPAALLGALLVALLLATPIMPSRRVRTALEGGYQGKRRKG